MGRPARRPAVWLIDLDNTLHDASWRLMGEINHRMTDFVARKLGLSWQQASRLRASYWKRYGATLTGLVRHHGVDASEFLTATHPSHDLQAFVRQVTGLRRQVARLPGQRWLLTNAPRQYTRQILSMLGLSKSFQRTVCIEDMRGLGQLKPKPSRWLWRRMLRASGQPGSRLLFVDDSAVNLKAAHREGLRTARVWASESMRQQGWQSGRPPSARRPSYIRHQVNSWPDLIRRVAGSL